MRQGETKLEITTSCQDCVFADYVNNTQIGCKVGLLNKYITNKVAQEAYNSDIPGKEEFYILPGVACIGKINEGFIATTYNKDTTLNEAINFVKQQLKVKWQAIIILKDEDCESCLDALSRQKIKPENVTVILTYNSNASPGSISKLLKRGSFKTWRVMETENPELSRGNLVDLVLDKYTNPFYMVLEPTKVLDDNFIVDLNRIVNEEYINFAIIKMDGLDFVSTAIHKYFNGNSFGLTLEEKIIEEKCQDKIVNLKS